MIIEASPPSKASVHPTSSATRNVLQSVIQTRYIRRSLKGAKGKVDGGENGEEMFAEVRTCTFNRLITCVPKSGKPPRHARTPECKILTTRLLLHGNACMLVVRRLCLRRRRRRRRASH